MTIELLKKSQYALYEEFILNHENSMMYHTLKYKKLLEEYLKCKSFYFIAKSNHGIEGILPIFMKSGSMGKVYNSLPFYGSNGGILCNSKEAFNLLLNHYNLFINKDDILSATLITNPLETDVDYSSILFNETDERISQWTNLDYDNNHDINIMHSYHTKARNMVRKSLKYNFELIVNDDIECLHMIHHENMKAIDGIAKEIIFFEYIKSIYKINEDYAVWNIKYENKIIASMLVFLSKDTVEYYTPAIKAEYRNTQALTYIIYKAMIFYSQKGFKKWDWGGTWKSQDGVYRFKSRLGGIDKSYKYFTYI